MARWSGLQIVFLTKQHIICKRSGSCLLPSPQHLLVVVPSLQSAVKALEGLHMLQVASKSTYFQ